MLNTLLRILGEATVYDPLQPWWNARSNLRDWLRIFVEDRTHGVGRGCFMKSALASHHLVQHGAGRKDVAAGVGDLSAHLFRRHIPGRAQHVPRIGLWLVAGG